MPEHLNDSDTPVEHPLVANTIIKQAETIENFSDDQRPEVEQSGSPEEADDSSEIIPLKAQTGSEERHVRFFPLSTPTGFWRKVPKIVFFIVPILLVTLGVLAFAVYASVTSAHCSSPTETDEQPAGSTKNFPSPTFGLDELFITGSCCNPVNLVNRIHSGFLAAFAGVTTII
ncbi:hypothetical protein X801_10191 [Opisthorchis viverrini]|uniref:Uncharacterized protein n=2 Tax=Opisthorchis viverrini TaxID=6198 RepID=A0A1S8WHX3_OPIVI|nr:hypothetical protein T265_09083 [Opisthorchis viverrini]KER22910.1 hypothetical protein T265_09083 [Opisthorchis viverrini]OON14021.1 hypothetical protein X801_10191 [Opisthorchis viverrini]